MNRYAMVILGVLALLVGGGTASGQVRLENVSITMGVGGEVYGSDGNFLSIAVPQVDSTDSALGASGEMGANGTLIFMAGNGRSLSADFDFGMRQFWTDGFQARNYARANSRAECRPTTRSPWAGACCASSPLWTRGTSPTGRRCLCIWRRDTMPVPSLRTISGP